jgi:hypothetical protein
MGQGLDTPIQTAGHAGASPEVARRRLSGVQAVVVSGRHAFIGQRPTSGTLIDEQTGKRTVLSAPAGCSFTYFGFGETAALGAPWVVAACNPPRLYQLYNIPARAWTPLSSDPSRLFAFNADCKTGDPECVASYTAVGTRWIEFRIICGDHCGQATTYAFQNIQTGQVRDQPPDWKPGGTEIPDLNSPALTRKLCRPLRVLSVPPRRTSLLARGRVRGGAALTGRGSRCVRCPGAVRAGDPRSRGERGAGFSRRST